jgi:hypothetical protein
LAERNVWTEILNLREACELFLYFPAPDSDAQNEDREEDERVIRQQVQAAIAMAQASLNLLAAHVFRLHGDPTQGESE